MGNDVIDGLMPGYFTRDLLTHLLLLLLSISPFYKNVSNNFCRISNKMSQAYNTAGEENMYLT